MKNTYSALILAGGKGTHLYPLTPVCTKSLLPVGNKKLIYYQLELIQQAKIPKAYIVINNETMDVQKELSNNYQGNIQLVFINTPDNLQTYIALNILLNQREIEENLIILSGDVITNFSIKELLQFHQEKKSSFTFAVQVIEEKEKQKLKVNEKDKKKEEDQKEKQKDQGDLKLFLVDNDRKVAYVEALAEAEDLGVAISNAVLKGIAQAKFEKAYDSHIYVIDKQVLRIIRDFTDQGISNLASEFIPFLISNQCNTNLLKYTVSQNTIPTNPIRPYIYYIPSYMKRVITIKDYEQTNMKSLIRGEKEIKCFLPTHHSEKRQEDKDASGMISATVEQKEGAKINRSCVYGGVKIGKGVEIVNSVVLKGALIEDGCKIRNCIVGSKCHVKKDCVLKNCQIAPDSVVDENSKIEDDVILNQY